MQSAPTAVSGTTVSINDTAAKTDRFNLSICEVLPLISGGTPTWSISGTISPSAAGVRGDGQAHRRVFVDGER